MNLFSLCNRINLVLLMLDNFLLLANLRIAHRQLVLEQPDESMHCVDLLLDRPTIFSILVLFLSSPVCAFFFLLFEELPGNGDLFLQLFDA